MHPSWEEEHFIPTATAKHRTMQAIRALESEGKLVTRSQWQEGIGACEGRHLLVWLSSWEECPARTTEADRRLARERLLAAMAFLPTDAIEQLGEVAQLFLKAEAYGYGLPASIDECDREEAAAD